MGKVSDYMTGRNDGLLLALKLVKDGGIENLEKEIEFRNITGLNTALAKKDLDEASVKIKEMTIDTFTILSVATLRKEFKFGAVRLGRFVDGMNARAELLIDDMATWDGFIKEIEEDVGIKLRLRRND